MDRGDKWILVLMVAFALVWATIVMCAPENPEFEGEHSILIVLHPVNAVAFDEDERGFLIPTEKYYQWGILEAWRARFIAYSDDIVYIRAPSYEGLTIISPENRVIEVVPGQEVIIRYRKKVLGVF